MVKTQPALVKQLKRSLGKIEEELAGIASPMVWLFSSAPESVKNAITALMPALVVLFVFHGMLVAAGGTDGWFHVALCNTLGMKP